MNRTLLWPALALALVTVGCDGSRTAAIGVVDSGGDRRPADAGADGVEVDLGAADSGVDQTIRVDRAVRDVGGVTTWSCKRGAPGGGGPAPQGCLSDDDCQSHIFRICNQQLGMCSKCNTDDDCKPARPRCLPASDGSAAFCFECAGDEDCTLGPGTTDRCDSSGRCLECATDQDCSLAGLGSYCFESRCEECGKDEHCVAGPGGTGQCHPLRLICIQCLDHADCVAGPGNTGLCHDGECTGCEDHTDCVWLDDSPFCLP